MRIISGKYKGRRISPPKGLPVRPTTDMSKEALFNVLNNHFSFEGLKILDLFAGTGNISYEFASRGSTPITSVDGDFGCVKFIKQVATEYDFNIAATKSDVFTYLERCKTSYDIIFADSPYCKGPADRDFIVELAEAGVAGLLKSGGVFIAEVQEGWGTGREGAAEIDGLNLVDTRRYGKNMLLFYQLPEK